MNSIKLFSSPVKDVARRRGAPGHCPERNLVGARMRPRRSSRRSEEADSLGNYNPLSASLPRRLPSEAAARKAVSFLTLIVLCAFGEALTAAEANKPDGAKPPGVVIDHRAASTKQYIGSPSIAILPSGDYAASHDWFGPGSTYNRTVVFASHDKGESWKHLTEIEGQWWSTLFVHNGALYLMGTSRENGKAVIRRSTDGGKNWTTPSDANSGLLLGDGKYHCAPVPVVTHNGRLWRAMENVSGPGGWGRHFHAFMMSAPVNADLLNATNWTASNHLEGNAEWLDGNFGGWLEGNAVVTPDGQVVDILRADYRAGAEKAAIISISADGKRAAFDPKTGFIDFPGGCKKFTIRYDPPSKHYWSLANYVPEAQRNSNPERTRNTLALINSSDLKTWNVRRIILQHPDSAKHGFQYSDWLFEGDDIIAVVRTAFDDGLGGAHNQHDANYMTFHRIKNFRRATDGKIQ